MEAGLSAGQWAGRVPGVASAPMANWTSTFKSAKPELVLPDSFYSPRVASHRGSLRCVHEVRRGEKRCLSSLRLLTWR
jgi:hypothetical protein